MPLYPQLLTDQLTLSHPRGTDYAPPPWIFRPSYGPDLESALHSVASLERTKKAAPSTLPSLLILEVRLF